MCKVIFIILFFNILGAFGAKDNEKSEWQHAVEEILASVRLGPLKEEFSPSYLAKRKFAASFQLQSMKLRALIAGAMVESLGSDIHLCQPMGMDDRVVREVLNEFRERGFDKISWTKGGLLCNVIQIEIPHPQNEL